MHRTFSYETPRGTRPDFYSLFPVPDFLSMKTLGFDISDNSIKLVEFLKKNGVMRLGFYATAEMPHGTIESGQIMNYTGLQEIITELQRRHKFVFVDASLPEQKAYLYTTTIEGGDDISVRENIEFHLEENIPLTKAEAVFDYEVFRTYTKDKKTYKEVTVSAISRTVSESYVALLKRSGLRPISLSIEAEAVANAIVPDGDTGTYLIVDYGKTRTGISVISEGVTRLTSTTDVGGAHITETVAQKLKISSDEAERLKQEYGLLGTGEALEISRVIEERIMSITREIDGQLRYWHSKTDERGIRSKRVGTILICGGGALLKGIETHLKKNLSVNVELANVWSNATFPKHYIPEITFEDSLKFAAAIGLALKH
jgi:type IV pilus assembly protein PilM